MDFLCDVSNILSRDLVVLNLDSEMEAAQGEISTLFKLHQVPYVGYLSQSVC